NHNHTNTLSLHDALPISPEDQYRTTGRGGKGIVTCKLEHDTGHVVAVKAVTGEEDLMLITTEGVLIRIPVQGISETGRNTQGVCLIRLEDGETVASAAKVDPEIDDEAVDDKPEDTHSKGGQSE